MLLNIPNILSLFRIAAAPFLLFAGWFEKPTLFFILLGLMLLSDVLDGFIARMWNQTSELGAKLDSYGDGLTYLCTALAAWWLWPESIKAELSYIIAVIIIYLLPLFFALAKFGKIASYHTWITKISAVLMSTGLILFLGFDDVRLFYFSVYFLLIEMFENIAITMILPKPQSNVHSLWHVWKTRKV